MSHLAVGKYTIELGNINGAVINRGTAPKIVLVDSPPNGSFVKSEGDNQVLGVENAISRIVKTFQSCSPVELLSFSELEQTTLLRCLASHSQINSLFPDGTIYILATHSEVEDILQSIWEAFYQSDIPYKATPEQIQLEIADKKALIVLDENKLIQDEFKELFKTAPKCRFLFTSSQRKILDAKSAIELAGWEDKDIIFFLENKLQRSLKTEEIEAAKALRSFLKGNPRYIKLAVINIAENGLTLNKLVSQLPDRAPQKYIVKQILESLTNKQLHIIELLAVMGDVGLESKEVVSITQSSEDFGILEELRKNCLLNFNASRYTLSKLVREFFSPPSQLLEPLESALTYFKKKVQKYQSDSYRLCPEIDATVHLLEIAVTASRWQDVLNLGMSVESSLVLSRRWGLWKQVLKRILQASQAEQDKAIQAWAYHQLGTCSLCLEDNSTANDYLNKALELRISLDDKTAIAATRHNLDLLDVDSPLSETHLLPDSMSKTARTLLDSPGESGQNNTLIFPDNNLTANKDKEIPTRIYPKGTNFKIFRNPYPQKVSSSSRGIVAAGVFLSGGLLGWLSWDNLTHVPENPTSNNSQSSSPEVKSEPTPTLTPSPTPTRSSIGDPEVVDIPPVAEPELSSEVLGKPPSPEPPLVPSLEYQDPSKKNIYNFNSNLNSPSKLKKSKPQTELNPKPTSTPTPESSFPELPPLSPIVKPSIESSPTMHFTPTPKAIQPAKTNSTVAPNPTPTPTSTIFPKVKVSPSEEDKFLQDPNLSEAVPEPTPLPSRQYQ